MPSDPVAPSAPVAPRKGGRPSRAHSEALAARIVGQARQLFLAQGYGATSIEAVVQACLISKRTFYHRFPDKATLFKAVVHQIVADLHPPASVPLIRGESLHARLLWLAGLILTAGLSAPGLALHRLIVSEADRFPDLGQAVAAEGGSAQVHQLIGSLLSEAPGISALPEAQRVFLAEQFLTMVLSIPRQRVLGVGAPMSEKEQNDWCLAVVDFFTAGLRGLMV